ncbi:MAG: AbrB/MazE/SpoVT family DNA-binding domain-containing protein [Candidatus Binataceae bacterium]
MTAGKRPLVRTIASSKLTPQGRTTIPAFVRKMLHLKAGDTMIFEESKSGTIRIRKAQPLEIEYLSELESTLSEWNSKNDARAYRDL